MHPETVGFGFGRPSGEGAPEGIEVTSTDASIRLAWNGEPGARWLVERVVGKGRRLLTPVPLVNPFFSLSGLPALTEMRFLVSRLGESRGTEVTASTSFPPQAGFPQRIGAK